MARIFTPFEQGDASITRRYGGSGVGLSVCRKLVEAMGGASWSPPNPTPARPSASSCPIAPVPVAAASPAADEAASPAEGLRILVVDDNASTA